MTILELMTVIGIVAILAAIGIPNYISWLPKYRVGTAIRQLYTEMHLVKMNAIAENNNYIITFDTTANSYSIYDDDDNDGADVADLVKTIVVGESAPNIIFGSVTLPVHLQGLHLNQQACPTKMERLNFYLLVTLPN